MKGKKILSTLASLVVATGLLLTTNPLKVSAATPTASGTEAAPAHVTINKHLVMPEGTITPAGAATFNFTALTVDGETATATNMPAIPARTINFTTADAGTTTSGVKTVSKESVNIVDGITFPHAGEYIYTVTEAASGFTLTNDTDTTEEMAYSTKIYYVQVIVANNAAGTGTYVKSISVNNYTPASGASVAVVGSKVGDDDGAEGTDFSFENKFVRTHLNDSTNPGDTNDTNLRIKKVVAGDGGDFTQYFTFTVTVNAPAVTLPTTPTTYKAVVMENNATIDPAANGITGAGTDHVFTVTPGAAFTVKLKHNQSVVLLDAPVGSTYTASETAVANYTASYVQTANGVAGTSTTSNTVASTIIGEAANNLVMTNTKAAITPTGIVLSNLPYILVGIFAIAGLGFLMSQKHRRSTLG